MRAGTESKHDRVMPDSKRIPYDLKAYDSEWQTLRLTVDQNLIQTRAEAFEKIAEPEKQSWQSTAPH